MNLPATTKSARIFSYLCLCLALASSPARAVDVQGLPNAADEVINVIGNLPTYHNRAIGGVVNIDRLQRRQPPRAHLGNRRQRHRLRHLLRAPEHPGIARHF